MPVNSKLSIPTPPKLAQNRDWDDSNKLKKKNNIKKKITHFKLIIFLYKMNEIYKKLNV